VYRFICLVKEKENSPLISNGLEVILHRETRLQKTIESTTLINTEAYRKITTFLGLSDV
jgi:hypothetical protein